MDTEILEDLGLTKAEIRVYVSLLELGNSSAGAILEKSKLQNSVVHRALNSLIEKGLISFIFEGQRKVYSATDPENFYDFIDDKRKKFEQFLPELKKKQREPKEEKGATVYKGKKGINELYMKLLNSNGKEYNTYGGGKKVTYDVMGETWWKSFHTKRIAKNIESRQVFDDSLKEFGRGLNKKPLTNIKFISKTFEQLTETIIIKDYVAIVIFSEDPYGLLIKDNLVAEGYKKNFERLWKQAKK